MRFINIIGSSIFQLLSIFFVFGYLLGILNVYFSDNNDYCVMTYMFEYPQFVRITVPENKIYPQYGLYAYSEGRFTENARRMWFDGVPVLFLPGNSGSHMQARSLASVALRKAISKDTDFHFDFFTVSYNEELSGLYGGVLQSQTDFASACVSKILSLYKSNRYTKSVPTSVILIGHSMGGLIAKRLLAYPSTINTTNIAITLASPLEAPVINFDMAINNFYIAMDTEWDAFININEDIRQKKLLISFGSGPRDLLLPSGLTSSNESYIGALTTAIPGVWVSPDHVGIVWCKQLVLAINRYLFDIVDPLTEQVSENNDLLRSKAKQYFQANRSMMLDPNLPRNNASMIADAFWYEDNRRIYQISRPEIDKTTYLMIRLVSFPQNRFVAVEAINVDDQDWIFGCTAKYSYNTHRYCKFGTSLNELSRWTATATDFGKRKLATVHLHNIMENYPEWTHVVVKVSPTRKPIALNVDINDHASRVITVDLPSDFSFTENVVKQETDAGSLYYELILPDFNAIHQAYLLYVEPTANCRVPQYHVSAEMHVPWAKNHETFHYFTQSKRTPMKMRLFKTNPNVTLGLDPLDHVKITLLLDPQCQYTISISTTWYLRLAQLVRNYTPMLIPFIAAIVLLASRSNILNLQEKGTCISFHGALMTDGVKPYHALVFGRFAAVIAGSMSISSFLFENSSSKNFEVMYFTRSLLVLPVYMTALGLVNVMVGILLAVMVFSSQLAHRLLFRIVWRGSSNLAEKVASGLQKVPMVVSATLICAAPLSCGAASMAAGAAFYAFMLSKMYEEYLEDYVYKMMAKVASRICRIFTKENKSSLSVSDINTDIVSTNTKSDGDVPNTNEEINEIAEVKDTNTENEAAVCESTPLNKNIRKNKGIEELDEELNNLNFHIMMFCMWVSVLLVNVPALLTWARNFKYSMVLQPDTSYHTGLVLSACSSFLWQMEGPRRNLRYYNQVSTILFAMAILIIALGPNSLTIVNYGVTLMFAIITLQQVLDKEIPELKIDVEQDEIPVETEQESKEKSREECDDIPSDKEATDNKNDVPGTSEPDKECDVCNESRIYNIFKNLREKISFNEDVQ